MTSPNLTVGCAVLKIHKGLAAKKEPPLPADPENSRRNAAVKAKLMTQDPEMSDVYHLNTSVVAGKNAWPFFFSWPGFDAWKVVVADTMSTGMSEAKCEALFRYMNLPNVPRHVLVVGGNTAAGGAASMIAAFEGGQLFDHVVYSPLSQYGA